MPVYYMAAGLWLAAGRLCGMNGGALPYWARFLNVPLFVGLIAVSYLLARTLFAYPDMKRIALPTVVTFFPQDAFYSINSDGMSALLFSVSFFLLLQLYFESKTCWYYLLAGLVVAATLLVKLSNVPVTVLFGVIIVLKTWNLTGGRRPGGLACVAVLFTSAAVVVIIWLRRNYLLAGEFTAAALKIEQLGWTEKAPGQLLNHPILTPAGLFYFLCELTKSFWRGEFVWHLEPMASPGSDFFYTVSTFVFILASVLGLALRRNEKNRRLRFVFINSLVMMTVSVLLLAILSMRYDFGDCWYPSRERPYFVSGRLILGVLLPFLLIYLDGFERILSKLKARINPLFIVALISVGVTVGEFALSWAVFTSPYNWFGLK